MGARALTCSHTHSLSLACTQGRAAASAGSAGTEQACTEHSTEAGEEKSENSRRHGCSALLEG